MSTRRPNRPDGVFGRDQWDKEMDKFDRDFDRAKRFGIVWFVICALVALASLGLIAWAVITLVTYITSK